MRLVIAEKEELAKAIADAISVSNQKKDGYYDCGNGVLVTYCMGHMLSLCTLEEHAEVDGEGSGWNKSLHPYKPSVWRKKVTPKPYIQAQYQKIKTLIQEAKEIIHAGDPDEEGQLIVDEILQFEGIGPNLSEITPQELKSGSFQKKYSVPVYRLQTNDNTPSIIQKEMKAMRPNQEFLYLGVQAEARSLADFLYGVNLTRAYTLKAQSLGYVGLVSIGRVQTPILGMIVRRTRDYQNHKESFYFPISGTFGSGEQKITARYQPKEGDPTDEKGNILEESFAKDIVAQIPAGSVVQVESLKRENKQKQPPLLYNLLKLQIDANTAWGYKPSEVDSITQSLRDKKLITYNRSDSQYLREEHHEQAPQVFETVSALLQVIGKGKNALLENILKFVPDANFSLMSRVFNAKKVTAHHAIIPTFNSDFGGVKLSEQEANIYCMIAMRYLLQFFPPMEYEQTSFTLVYGNTHTFKGTSQKITKQGWTSVQADEDKEEEFQILDTSFLQEGGECEVAQIKYTRTKTKPKPLYKYTTLLADLARVANTVKDEHLKALLKEKDKGKEGESGGIGTPATRSAILTKLLEVQFIEENSNGNLIPTDLGTQLYDSLPSDEAKYPDLTAIWFEQQQAIGAGDVSLSEFIEDVFSYTTKFIGEIEKKPFYIKSNAIVCPKCKEGGLIRRKNTKKGKFFWGCSNCPQTYNDLRGKPDTTEAKTAGECPECKEGILTQRGKGKDIFWGCSRFPECKKTFQDYQGKPDIKGENTGRRTVSKVHSCTKCGAGLVRRPTKDKKKHFWGCSNYPECKAIYWEKDGAPVYNN